MKSCPSCKTRYSDDTLRFCLQDGTPLVGGDATETFTVVLDDAETVVARSGHDRVNVPPAASGWQQSQVTRVAGAVSQKKGSRTAIAVIVTAVGMLVLFGVIGLAALAFWRNSRQTSIGNVSIPPNTNVSGANTSYNSNPTPYATSTPVRTPTPFTPASTPQPPSATPPAPPPLVRSSYPSTTRLKFARGAYSTSFSGDINPGDSRSLVLGCRAGQSLSANVSSGSGCVQLRGGGSSLRTMTTRGDNYISVTNNCSSVVHFSVSITII